jgi:serine/threonine protein kinase
MEAQSARLSPRAELILSTVMESTAGTTERLEDFPEGMSKAFLPVKCIGQGEGATVFLVQEILAGSQHRRCAVRLTSPQIVLTPEVAQLFLQDARDAGRLKHDNIIPYFGAGQLSGRYFISMEYAQGEPLRDVMRKLREARRAAPDAAVMELGRQCAAALAYAHQRTWADGSALIHRDLNPANVFVHDDGRVRISEFGVARAAGQMIRGGRMVLTGGARYCYRGPEVLEGAPSVTPAADVFSLGAILLELVAGVSLDSLRNIFSGKGTASLHAEVNALAPKANAGLRLLLARMLQPLPSARPSSAEVLAELTALQTRVLPLTAAVLLQAEVPDSTPAPRRGVDPFEFLSPAEMQAMDPTPSVGPYREARPADRSSAVKAPRSKQWQSAVGALGFVLAAVAAFVLWPAPSRVSSPQRSGRPAGPSVSTLHAEAMPGSPGKLKILSASKYGGSVSPVLDLPRLGLSAETRPEDIEFVFDRENPNHLTLVTSMGDKKLLTLEELGFPEGVDAEYLAVEAHNRDVLGSLRDLIPSTKPGSQASPSAEPAP